MRFIFIQCGFEHQEAKTKPVSPLSPQVSSSDSLESGLASNLAGQKQPPVSRASQRKVSICFSQRDFWDREYFLQEQMCTHAKIYSNMLWCQWDRTPKSFVSKQSKGNCIPSAVAQWQRDSRTTKRSDAKFQAPCLYCLDCTTKRKNHTSTWANLVPPVKKHNL